MMKGHLERRMTTVEEVVEEVAQHVTNVRVETINVTIGMTEG